MLRTMCCFTRAVPFVGQTKIFARGLPDGRQALVYAMKVDVKEELAMVLPLPVPPGSPDDAVEFVDLSGYSAFFTDLAKAFPEWVAMSAAPQGRGFAVPKSMPLRVVEVGAFEASFVPRVQDFSRLDERFRMPRGFFEALPMYADHGFAVFRLKPTQGAPRLDVHPMAFRFPRRDAKTLFFPTVHVHDGSVPKTAQFDHKLTAQTSPLMTALLGQGTPGLWTASPDPLGASIDNTKDHGLTDGAQHGYQLALSGALPNHDMCLREPDGLTLADVAGEGDVFSWQLRGAAAFSPMTDLQPHRAWAETARTRLPQVARALGPGISALVKRLSGQLSFAPLSVAKEPHFLNGRQLWTGTDYVNGKNGAGRGAGYVQFTPFTKTVEPQSVRIGFARLPDEAGVEAVLRGLEDVLQSALR